MAYQERVTQVINGLTASRQQLGLLIDSGHYPKIEHERSVNHDFGAFRVSLSFNEQ